MRSKKAESRLKDRLDELRTHGLVAIKTGTEVEDMSFGQISILRDLTSNLLPLYVKIGGPEARNDIRNLISIGVDGLIAPMIESQYALKNFIHTLKAILTESQYLSIDKGINLETITAYRSIDSILSAKEARELNQITAARTDLSGSMNLQPDDPDVLECCTIIVARSKEFELKTSIGGAIHSGIIEKLIRKCTPDTINTRHMVISAQIKQPAQQLEKMLQFEHELYRYLASLPENKYLIERVRIIEERMKKSGVIPA